MRSFYKDYKIAILFLAFTVWWNSVAAENVVPPNDKAQFENWLESNAENQTPLTVAGKAAASVLLAQNNPPSLPGQLQPPANLNDGPPPVTVPAKTMAPKLPPQPLATGSMLTTPPVIPPPKTAPSSSPMPAIAVPSPVVPNVSTTVVATNPSPSAPPPFPVGSGASQPPPPLVSGSLPVRRPMRLFRQPFRRFRSGSGQVIEMPMSFTQSRDIMLNSAPPAPPPSAEAQDAFNSMMQKNMPLTPQQVVRLRQLIDTSQRAAAIMPNVPPKPVSTTLMVNLAPGSTPPAIRLAQGYVSSLVFVDSVGSPWPIASFDVGEPKAMNIQWDGKSNILLIQAVAPYSDSNMVIRLVGLPTPITLEIVSGQRVVDYRVDLHVSGIGPLTKDIPIGTPLPNSANQILLSVLDGVAPAGSRTLRVFGGDCQAWLLGNTMFLRTRLTVLSPGWVGRMVSPDGMIAYEMMLSSSVLVSQYGNPIELKIEGF